MSQLMADLVRPRTFFMTELGSKDGDVPMNTSYDNSCELDEQ